MLAAGGTAMMAAAAVAAGPVIPAYAGTAGGYLNGKPISSLDRIVRYPRCGSGVPNNHLVADYSLRIPNTNPAEYYLENLYCGNSSYGFRHIEAADKGTRISSFPGGWGGFNYALTASAHAWTDSHYDATRKLYSYTDKNLCLSNGTEWHQFIPFTIVVTGPNQTTGVGANAIITAYGKRKPRQPGGCP